MSRTNTAAYESIKASQLTFQNPDRTFPEPGAVLMIDNFKGATALSRNLDIKSLTLSGSSSTGILTYDNQLLVNGLPVGGGGADISGGSNISVDSSAGVQVVLLDVREEIDMQSNSIVRCKTIELPRIPLTSSAKITFGDLGINKYGIISYEDTAPKLLITSDTNVETRGISGMTLVGAEGVNCETYVNKSIRSVVKDSFGNRMAAMELDAANTLTVGATDISTANPTIVLLNDISHGSISFNRNGELYLSADSYAMNAVPSGSFANVLGYDVSSGEIRYQPASGGSDLCGGYNISIDSGAINMDISQPVIMNNNPIVDVSYIDISAGGNSSRLSHNTLFNSLNTTKYISISGIENPTIFLQNNTSGKFGRVAYSDVVEQMSLVADNIILESAYGAIGIFQNGPNITSYDNKIVMRILTGSQLSGELSFTPQNVLQLGSSDISLNPAIVLQGGKASTPSNNTSARIEYFDASGIEQMRLTSKNYAFDAVPAAASALPTVLGYDTSSGEIKAQPATNGISALSTYTYNTSGLLNVSGGVSLGAFAPTVSGVYGINFIITIANNISTPIVFNNTQDSFELLVWNGIPPAPPPIKLTSIQNRPTSSIQTGIYTTTIYQTLLSGASYTLIAGNENRSGTCSWASCIVEVRIIRLC
jgi:hypothetical protein